MARSFRELTVKLKSDENNVPDDVEDSAKEGAEGGMTDGLEESGLTDMLGGAGLGALAGIGSLVGIVGSMDSIQEMFGGLLDIVKGYFIPLSQGLMTVMLPVMRLLARVLPHWLNFMQSDITGNKAVDTLIKGGIAAGALITGTIAISTLVQGALSIGSYIAGSIGVGSLLSGTSLGSLITGTSLSSLAAGSITISGAIAASAMTVGGIALGALVGKALWDTAQDIRASLGPTASPTMAGQMTNSPYTMYETKNPETNLSDESIMEYFEGGGQNLDITVDTEIGSWEDIWVEDPNAAGGE